MKMWETTLWALKSEKKEGREVSGCHSRDSPATCGEDYGEAGFSSVACGGLYATASGYALKEAAAGGKPRLLAGAVAHGVSTLEQSVPEWLYYVKGPMLEQFLKNCSLCEGPTLEKTDTKIFFWYIYRYSV